MDYTEAMTVIDVNSGKYVTKKNDLQAKENAFYLVNREAAVEIAKQLRLRNISGMIIVDFINMNDDEHVQGIVKTLREEFKKDKVTTAYVDMTKLGLVEITRKREGAMLKEYINSEVSDEL
jgi:ribonuclease G